jgi:hypothetical protein
MFWAAVRTILGSHGHATYETQFRHCENSALLVLAESQGVITLTVKVLVEQRGTPANTNREDTIPPLLVDKRSAPMDTHLTPQALSP